MFFGTVVRPGKASPLVPHAEGYALHLSQAALAADARQKSRVSLLVHIEGQREPVVLCTLCAGAQDTVLLDQFFSEYAELSVLGDTPVHLTGYYSPQFSPEEEEEEEDEGEEERDADYAVPGQHPLDHLLSGMHAGADGHGGDEDEDDSMDEDEDEDEGSSEDEDEESSEGEGLPGAHHREPSVIIEDITDQENAKEAAAKAAAGTANGAAPKEAKKRKALPAPEAEAPAAAKKQAVGADKQQQKQKQPQQPQQQPKQQQQQSPQQQPKQKQQQTPQQQSKQQQTPQQQSKQQQQQQQAKTPEGKAAAGAAATSPAPAGSSGKKTATKRYDNGFEIQYVKMGDPNGKLAKGGKVVKVRYVGRLKSNGKVFDQTKAKPFSFRLGVGEVIKGWDRGVEGMRVGDKRKLVIPPQMGYGTQKVGPIPANSFLEFDVELVDVK